VSAFRLAELAQHVGGRVDGDPERRIRGIETLERAAADQLSFLTNPRYREAAQKTRAGAVLVGPQSGLRGPDLLEVAEPYLALARLLDLFHPAPPRHPGISQQARVDEQVQLGEEIEVGPFAVVERGAVLGDRVTVSAGCFVGEGCLIGDETVLRPNVVLYPGTRIGRFCLIHAGVVLGADGFGFATSGGEHHKVPQLGWVVVEDRVEIGANTTVDRGTVGETVIGEGSKLDNLVMIAHGVRVGGGSLLAAQSGVAGSTRLGERTTFAGQSGAAGHLEIGDGAIVGAKSAVFSDLAAKSFVTGVPAIDHRRWKRAQAAFKQLPDLQRELRDLRARLSALENKLAKEGEG
jgi:UDP-3-O-[3-hydroxymyristoyl] glucosamine N-acyltransferase